MNKLVELSGIPDANIEINTYWLFKNSMRKDLYNAHLIVRILAIENFFHKNNFGFNLYNKMQELRVNAIKEIPREYAHHEREFKDLIMSIKKYGFLKEYPIEINKYFRLVNGSHRLAIALYFNLRTVPIKFYPQTIDFDPEYSLKWFKQQPELNEYVGIIAKKYANIVYEYESRSVIHEQL